MSRPPRIPVRASKIEHVHAGRAEAGQPFRFFLTFTEADGPARALMAGREVRVMLDGYELAGLLHAIPGAITVDDADRQALVRVTCLLHRLAGGNGTKGNEPGDSA